MTEPADVRTAATPWKQATVHAIDKPTPRVLMLRCWCPTGPTQLPGQHYVIRLTAPDGYTAQRSYSLASSPADPLIELGVELLDDGEVSGYLGEVAVDRRSARGARADRALVRLAR